jgi:hypothetical protein
VQKFQSHRKNLEPTLDVMSPNNSEEVKKELRHRSLDDLHSRMSWWACFKSEEKSIAPSVKIEI